MTLMIKSCVVLLIITLPLLVSAQEHLMDRKYQLGDSYQYKLTCSEYNNGNWESTIVSVCKLSVGRDSNGLFFDEIHWISKKVFSSKDTSDQTDKAILVKPYYISLQKNGKLDLPKIDIPAMTEPIQDFNTFFVAVSPQMGTTELKSAGDSILKKDLVKADFSNGDFIIKGEDCFSIKLKLTGVSKETVMTEVDFLPPQTVCFPYLLDEMKVPVIDATINNFQMVQPTGNQKFNVQYGREIFYINSINQRNDGKLLTAVMNNTLNLKLKINCDKDYKNSQAEIPFTIQRNLTLELLKSDLTDRKGQYFLKK